MNKYNPLPRTKSEFKKYLMNELNWPEKNADEWCDYLIQQGMLDKEESK